MDAETLIEPVRKTVHVRAPVAHAFAVFTDGLASWWPFEKANRPKPLRTVRIEPGVGGRWLEIATDGGEMTVATIRVWEPPHRLVLVWQMDHEMDQCRADPAMASEVEVRFIPEGPEATRVELVHDRFETMGAGPGSRLRDAVAGGWPGLMERYAEEAGRLAA